MARFIKRNWMWMMMAATMAVAGPLLARSSGETARQRSLDALTEIMELVQKPNPRRPAS
jgi:hypothetical protein